MKCEKCKSNMTIVNRNKSDDSGAKFCGNKEMEKHVINVPVKIYS